MKKNRKGSKQALDAKISMKEGNERPKGMSSALRSVPPEWIRWQYLQERGQVQPLEGSRCWMSHVHPDLDKVDKSCGR